MNTTNVGSFNNTKLIINIKFNVMKRINLKFLPALAILLVSSLALSAQPQGQGPQGGRQGGPQGDRPGGEKMTAEQRAEKETNILVKKLELTDAQKSKIESINLEYATKQEESMQARKEQMKEARENKSEVGRKKDGQEPKDRMEAVKQEKKEKLVAIMAVLTDSQKVEYALLLGDMKSKNGAMGQRPGGRRGGPMMGGQRGPQRGRPMMNQRGPQRGGDDQRGPQRGGDDQRPPRGENQKDKE